MPDNAPCFRHTVRVYWEDTDAGGVVFYANYLKFFERARSEWLRSFGFGQESMRTQGGAMFVVSETAVRYLKPARLDDLLDITVEVRAAARASLVIAQRALRCDAARDEELLAEGTIRIACVDAGTFRLRRIPIDVLATIEPEQDSR